MKYTRSSSICDNFASDLVGETLVTLSNASLVFKEEKDYSVKLVNATQSLHEIATKMMTMEKKRE